jgi:chromosome segregation ATPase
LDVDRERSASAKLQKELEQGRRSTAELVEQHRAHVGNLAGEIAQLRQKLSGTEAALTEARAAGDQLRAHLDRTLPLPTRVVRKRKSA